MPNDTVETPPSTSINPETWAAVFVRKSRLEPGFAQDVEAVTGWFNEAMDTAYQRGLKDGAML